MKRLWLITQGECEVRAVICVCDCEQSAKRIADICKVEFNDVIEISQISLFEDTDIPKQIWVYNIETVLHDNGKISGTRQWAYPTWNFELIDYTDVPQIDYVRAPCLDDKAGFLRVTGTDEQAVLKATIDKVNEFASKSWIPKDESK
jgi:hypothetical protein